MMSKELTVKDFSTEQLDLIKATVAKDTTDDELKLFLYTCKTTGLDPLLKQAHAVKRWDSRLQRQAMAIQVGIDGYRLIADRTGRYCPGREPTFTYDDKGVLASATSYIKKRTKDGTWHEVAATCLLKEYMPKGKDGTPTGLWKTMAHNQLAKCAEALAIRKAFPAECSSLHADIEMDQATSHDNGGVVVLNPEEPQVNDDVAIIPKHISGIGGKRLDDPEVSVVQLDAVKASLMKMTKMKDVPEKQQLIQAIDHEMQRRKNEREEAAHVAEPYVQGTNVEISNAALDIETLIVDATTPHEVGLLKEEIRHSPKLTENDRVTLLAKCNDKLRGMTQ